MESEAIGTGGDISISTGSLFLSNGAQLFASTRGRGEGDAGNVTITDRDNISFNGASVFSNVEAREAVGTGGKINITGGSLSLINGELAVNSRGQGSAGSVTISARDNITLNGFGVFSGVESEAIGTSGDISISTDSLSLSNGAQMFASTRGRGDAGNVTIAARDNISFDGTAVFTTVEPQAVGNGGDINISTGSLSLINNAQLNTESNGQGAAGDIKVRARSIQLDDGSGILARTASGNGGDITLTTQDFLLLRRQSQISTNAGTAQQGGDGGNITINAPFLIAIPSENSNITANAFTGRGGRVDITTSGIFGIQPRLRETLLSDITASSDFGVSGDLTINTSPVDFGLGLVELPASLADAGALIASSCAAFADKEGSEFIVTGRGGLPPSPDEPLTNDVIWSDTRIPNITAQQHPRETTLQTSSKKNAVEVVPATGWVFNGKGEVTLISNASNTAGLGNTSAACASAVNW